MRHVKYLRLNPKGLAPLPEGDLFNLAFLQNKLLYWYSLSLATAVFKHLELTEDQKYLRLRVFSALPGHILQIHILHTTYLVIGEGYCRSSQSFDFNKG